MPLRTLPNSLGALVVCAALALPAAARAQSVTTGSLAGLVTDESGGVLPGASVEILHDPTGTRYLATTAADGRFSVVGVRVGAPYSVVVRLDGFQEEKRADLSVALGEERRLDFRLKLAGVTESIEVTGEA